MLKENSSATEALTALYQANNAGIWLWAKDGALKFKAPENADTGNLLQKLKEHKSDILGILIANGITEDKPIPSCIYRIDSPDSVLSFAQQRLWFIDQFESGTSAYHLPAIYELSAGTDPEGIRYAMEQIVVRHEILRTTITQDAYRETGIQTVRHEPLPIEEIRVAPEEDYHRLIREKIDKSFQLGTEYPIRVTLFHIEPIASKDNSSIILLINSHHIANDGWSADLLETELVTYYEAYCNKQTPHNFPELKIQYKDYAFWQINYLSGDVLKTQLDYWRNKLSGFQPLMLPTDYARPAQTDYKGSATDFRISSALSGRLRALARKHGVTMHSIMLSGFHLLLSKYTNQTDIITGSPNANRHHRQTENLIGFFINTQINRTVLDQHQSFEELILKVHRDQMEAQQHQDLPFEKLVNELAIERDSSRHPVFQIIFEVQSLEEEKDALAGSKYLKRLDIRDYYNVERFDLSVFVNDGADTIHTTITYATSLFKKETIERLCLHYSNLLEQLTLAPDTSYSTINQLEEGSSLLSSERGLLLNSFNAIPENYSGGYRSVISLFRQQVELHPDKPAICFHASETTYHQLDEQSDLLSCHLKNRLLAQDKNLIGIMLDRSDKMIIAILAVLKASAAYVPIDPIYPDNRKEYIINDAAITLLITQSDYLFGLDYYHGELFAIDIELDLLEAANITLSEPDSRDLAYIIYTSGSTGQPKGCTIRHCNLSHYVQWANNYYFSSAEHGNFGLYTSLSFDLTVTSIFCCLTRGKMLTVYPQDMELIQILEHSFSKGSRIDSIKITPSHIKLLEPLHLHSSSIGLAIVGGEAIGTDHVRILKGINQNLKIVNEYGPTETTVGCIVQELEPDAPILIGKPAYGTKIYILNESLNLVPVGMTGEICISGMGVGAGYLNKPQLNAEKFIENPFEPGQLIYRTGDMGRWLPDGTIDYRGRNDDQVKVRGYRIELGEIEHAMMQTRLFRKVCVLVKDRYVNKEQHKHLVAYYVPDLSGKEADITTMQDALSKTLPDYMVPGSFIRMDDFPLTVNGKLDKQALPDPEFDRGIEYVAPTSSTEQAFCIAWQEVLGVEHVGITDDFFNIGGDSILSIRLVSRIKQSGYTISVRDIFNYRTIKEIIPHITTSEPDSGADYEAFSCMNKEDIKHIISDNNLNPDHVEDIYPAGYLQVGMLIEAISGKNAYLNVDSFMINESFDQQRFESIWNKLIAKHEQLRTAFLKHHSGYSNVIYKSIDLRKKIILIDELREPLEQFVDAEKNVGFNYAVPGLFRLFILPGAGSFTLLFSHHHALADGWSVAFLMADFADSYVNGQPLSKDPKPLFGKFISKEIQAAADSSHKQFWANYLAGYELKSHGFFTGNPTQPLHYITSQKHLSSGLNTGIFDLARNLKLPVDLVFFGIYNLVLSRFYDTHDLVIGTAANNRLEEEGGDRVFGLHLNTIPMRFITSTSSSITDYLLNILESKNRIDDYKLYPYAKIKSDLSKEENLYQCSFNYVHFHVEEKNYKSHASKQLYSAGTTSLSLILDVTRYENSFNISLRGSSDFIDKDTADKMIGSMVALLEEATLNPAKSIHDYSRLSESEYNQLVVDYNLTDKNYPSHKTIVDLVHEQALLNPHAIAVTDNGTGISFAQLCLQADTLAHELVTSYNILPQDKIGILLDRSAKMIIALLAVLKAGAAYVPIDPKHPIARKRFITGDTDMKVLITQSDYIFDLEFFSGAVFAIDLQLDTLVPCTGELQTSISQKDLAYIIYTSGTTGQPKGVMIEHAALLNYACNLADVLSPLVKTVDFSTNLAFDLSVTTTIAALALGKKLAIYSGESSDMAAYVKHLRDQQVDFIKGTPSLLANIPLDLFEGYILEQAFIGGEKLESAQLRKIKAYVKNPIDEYGPTEATVGTTFMNKASAMDEGNIGMPYANYRVYVLDTHRVPVPVGVAGELYIGGAGVARGYLNQPELTAERFIQNPFASEEDIAKGYNRLYKTGDLVKWLPDGNLQYIGRNDEQVKIRGYRIELAEIEKAMTEIDGIKQACVIAKELKDGVASSKSLVAYYEPENNADPGQEKILHLLSDVLPEYMIPAVCLKVEAFPLTINGKLDKKTLSHIGAEPSSSAYVAPETDIEKEICRIWQEVLQVEKIGLTDNFFKIGGNSIIAIQLSHKMSKYLQCDVNVADILKLKTIRLLLNTINTIQADTTNIEWTV